MASAWPRPTAQQSPVSHGCSSQLLTDYDSSLVQLYHVVCVCYSPTRTTSPVPPLYHGVCVLLTDEDHQPVLGPALPAVGSHLLVGGHVSHVVLLTLLTLIHGLVGLLVSPAEAETPAKTSYKSESEKREREKRRERKLSHCKG